jgi:hypothetical protein
LPRGGEYGASQMVDVSIGLTASAANIRDAPVRVGRRCPRRAVQWQWMPVSGIKRSPFTRRGFCISRQARRIIRSEIGSTLPVRQSTLFIGGCRRDMPDQELELSYCPYSCGRVLPTESGSRQWRPCLAESSPRQGLHTYRAMCPG